MRSLFSIFLATLLAAPAFGIARGDNRQMQGGQRVKCAVSSQFTTITSACDDTWGCEAYDEGAHGADADGHCETADDPTESDVWTDRQGVHGGRTHEYGIIFRHVYDSGAEHIWDEEPPGGPEKEWDHTLDSARIEWVAVGQRTYTPWVAVAADLVARPGFEPVNLDLTLTCGAQVVTWNSIVGGTMPSLQPGDGVPCDLFADGLWEQAHEHGAGMLRSLMVNVGVGWQAAPQQGCGFGVELALLLPVLWALRRRVSVTDGSA